MDPYERRVLIFGGIYDGHLNDEVVAYSQYGWSKIGKLKAISFQMTAIEVNGRDILVFGGGGDMLSLDKNTEVWRVSLIFGSIIIIILPFTDSHAGYMNKKIKPVPGEDRLGTFEVHEIEPMLRSWYQPIVITF